MTTRNSVFVFFKAVIAFSASPVAAIGVLTTPHDSYSSSVGVLGCKIKTDRVAYWPGSVDCTNICVQLTYNGRSVNLLRIDQSGGAHDISYDAWNYLQTGQSAAVAPISGGSVAMDYEEVDASHCADLILTEGSQLPLSASNSIDFLASCLADPGSWVANNHVLFNIDDPLCSLGYDEECRLDLATSNQPSCPHTLGLQTKLTTSTPVLNIEYPSGKVVDACTGSVVSGEVPSEKVGAAPAAPPTPASSSIVTPPAAPTAAAAPSSSPSAVPGLFLQLDGTSSSSSTSTSSSTSNWAYTTVATSSSTSSTASVNATTTFSSSTRPATAQTTISSSQSTGIASTTMVTLPSISSSRSASAGGPASTTISVTGKAGRTSASIPVAALGIAVGWLLAGL